MKAIKRPYIIWTACLLFLSGLGTSSLQTVVCKSDDGDVKLEQLCETWHGDSHHHHPPVNEDTKADHHDCCGDCTDLYVRLEGQFYRSQNLIADPGDAFLAPLDSQPTMSLKTPVRTLLKVPENGAPPNHGLELTSVIVLLC